MFARGHCKSEIMGRRKIFVFLFNCADNTMRLDENRTSAKVIYQRVLTTKPLEGLKSFHAIYKETKC